MKKENVHAKHKKSLAERFWKQKYLFLLLLPSLVWVILICYAPMTGLYMSFINYTPQGSGYFADMDFCCSLQNFCSGNRYFVRYSFADLPCCL